MTESDLRHTALTLLNRKAYFSGELKQKLLSKGFEEHSIEEMLTYCEEKGFIDDAELIEQWLHRWISQGKGPTYILFEAKKKGVPITILQEKLLSHYPKECQIEKATEHLSHYFEKKQTPSLKRKQKGYQYLGQKGFSSEIIALALEAIHTND